MQSTSERIQNRKKFSSFVSLFSIRLKIKHYINQATRLQKLFLPLKWPFRNVNFICKQAYH